MCGQAIWERRNSADWRRSLFVVCGPFVLPGASPFTPSLRGEWKKVIANTLSYRPSWQCGQAKPGERRGFARASGALFVVRATRDLMSRSEQVVGVLGSGPAGAAQHLQSPPVLAHARYLWRQTPLRLVNDGHWRASRLNMLPHRSTSEVGTFSAAPPLYPSTPVGGP